MQIAICDDESVFRNELTEYIIEYKKLRRVHFDIYEFTSGAELLGSDTVFDIVFLDYQMPNLDGMETARILRRRNCTCSIVFVTNYPDFVFESFEVNPYRFFRKPVSFEELESALDAFISREKMLAPIIINDSEGQKTVHSKNIVYLEGNGKYCTIRTQNETFHSSKTLSCVFDALPKHCFYRIHKSYAVNMYHIDKIANNEVSLTNGEKAQIGRNHITDFKRTYREFVKNYYLRS